MYLCYRTWTLTEEERYWGGISGLFDSKCPNPMLDFSLLWFSNFLLCFLGRTTRSCPSTKHQWHYAYNTWLFSIASFSLLFGCFLGDNTKLVVFIAKVLPMQFCFSEWTLCFCIGCCSMLLLWLVSDLNPNVADHCLCSVIVYHHEMKD